MKNNNKTTTRFIHKYAKIPTPNGTTGNNRYHTASTGTKPTPTGTKPAYTNIKPTSTGTNRHNRHDRHQPASPGTDSQRHPIKKPNQVMIIMNKSYQICNKIRPKWDWTVLVKQHRFYHTENFVFRQGHTLTMRDPAQTDIPAYTGTTGIKLAI